MRKSAVIRSMEPKSSLFNKSNNPNLNLDSRFAARPGMTKSGFTLIELLVVILIIGILAAVALPQYQKAVEKSRIMALMPNLRVLKESLERYYLANGRYPADSVLELDMSLGGCTFSSAGQVLCDGYCFNYNGGISVHPEPHIGAMTNPENCNVESTSTTYIKWYLDNSSTPGKRVCSSKVNGLCKTLEGFVEN